MKRLEGSPSRRYPLERRNPRRWRRPRSERELARRPRSIEQRLRAPCSAQIKAFFSVRRARELPAALCVPHTLPIAVAACLRSLVPLSRRARLGPGPFRFLLAPFSGRRGRGIKTGERSFVKLKGRNVIEYFGPSEYNVDSFEWKVEPLGDGRARALADVAPFSARCHARAFVI